VESTIHEVRPTTSLVGNDEQSPFYFVVIFVLFFGLLYVWGRLDDGYRARHPGRRPWLDPDREESTDDIVLNFGMRLRYLTVAAPLLVLGAFFTHVAHVPHNSLLGAFVFAFLWLPGMMLAWGVIFGRYSGD
jgi:hypothetical protein